MDLSYPILTYVPPAYRYCRVGPPPWTITVELPKSRVTLVIPAGYEIDGASIPEAFWTILRASPYGPWAPAATAHDRLYHAAHRSGVSRYDADLVFYTLLRQYGVSWTKARTMWLGVRAGGWVAWNKASRPENDASVEQVNQEGGIITQVWV